jgi:pyrimidine oxygenase
VPAISGILVGSYAKVAGMLDQMSEIPGVDGVMLIFDDFVEGMETFGTRVMPLMRCREKVRPAN